MKRYISIQEEIKYLTVYHGTSSLFINNIKKEGLKANSSMGYTSAKWYMVSSTKPSALFHASSVPEENRIAFVVEFKIPYDSDAKWEGYPYLWKPLKEKGYKWYALMQPIPKEYIIKITKYSHEQWLKNHDRGF